MAAKIKRIRTKQGIRCQKSGKFVKCPKRR